MADFHSESASAGRAGASSSARDAEFDALLASPDRAEAVHDSGSAAAQRTLTAAPDLGDFAASWELYRDPVLTGIFAGAALGFVGVFVVLRRAIFVTAAISQAAGLGVALALFLGIYAGVELPPVAGAVVLSLLVALMVGVPSRVPREAMLGFVYLTASAAAVIVGSRIGQEAHDVAAILFGTAVLVRPLDFWLVLSVGLVVVLLCLVARRGLLFAGLDPDAARVQGLPVRALETTLWSLVAVEVAVTTRALGALPVFAFAVLPAMAALALARRMHQALGIAAALGALSGGAGYVAAFLLDLPVGAAQAAVAALLCLISALVGRMRQR